jgi:hypothetical protein
VDYKQSFWYAEYLTDQTYRDPGHKNGKLFRRRFRIPFPVFEKLLKILEDSKKFEKAEFDCCGQPSAPLELLLLGSLRVLGRGICFDGLCEGSFISEEVHRVFFHKFCGFIAEALFPVYCAPPTKPEDIMRVMNEYDVLGFPGCIGSTDCVHVAWDRAPASLSANYTGKEKYPSLSY